MYAAVVPGGGVVQVYPGVHTSKHLHSKFSQMGAKPSVSSQGRPLGQWHRPPTHSMPSGQRLPQAPQWCSFLSRFTHLSLQRLWPSGQPQTFSSPRLMQFLEQHWESLLHSLPKRLQSLAQATPGKEANAAPRRAPPIHLIALPLERVPVASSFASSSKERLVVCWLTRAPIPRRAG